MEFMDRLKHAWDVFMNNRDPTQRYQEPPGSSYAYRPDRVRFTRGNERTIVTAICNRIALDVAELGVRHCRLDDDGRFMEYIESPLDNCLTLEANIDQTGKQLIQDIVMSMLDEGVVAVVPVETSINPAVSSSYDILSMRTAKVLKWYPEHVRLKLYNEKTGNKEEVTLPKKQVAIIENPLFAVMNEPNSTMQRLVRKLALLDAIDEQSGSGKLDLIIQLPYVVKSPSRKAQAEERRKDIEMQLSGSKYGIAYTDGTERITQLNRPVENNLMKQIEYLTSMLYSQLGMNQAIMDGTADETQNLNYSNITTVPIVDAIVNEFKRKFLTKTARTQRQTIMYFKDHFKLVPVSSMAEIADKLTRNEILSSNEIRQKLGFKPSKDPKADQLVNSNIAQAKQDPQMAEEVPYDEYYEEGENQNGEV